MTPRRIASALVLALTIAACSTSGRELPEPTMTTLDPALVATSTTAAAGTPATPVEGLDGFALASPSFVEGGEVPVDAGATTGNRSPALSWTNTPESAAELALVVTDDTGATIYWLVTGILTTDLDVPAGTVPQGGIEHASTAGPPGWNGPATPTGTPSTLVFALYALNLPIVAEPGETSHTLRERVIANSFATATVRGVFDGQGESLQGG
jgi:phosphatidylethanolamine-binding protein (PEBP) family uncharacterized protein